MTRGRKYGGGKNAEKILCVLQAAGTEKDGRPVAMRAAVLAERTGISHNNLSAAIDPLIELGQVVACEVKQARGRPTREFRLGMGVSRAIPKPLDAVRAGAATGAHRSASGVLPPIPATRPGGAAAAMQGVGIDRIQHMSEAEFAEYIAHLARVWAWGRAKRAA